MTDQDKIKNQNRARYARYRKKHWGKILERRRADYTKTPRKYLDKLQRDWFRKRYGLSMEEYDSLIVNPCQICGSNHNKKIDHDHTVSKPHYRGVLCNSCNLLLGRIESIGIDKFVKYLSRS